MDIETSQTLEKYSQNKYKYGFVTEIESDRPKKGLNEETIKYISKKNLLYLVDNKNRNGIL